MPRANSEENRLRLPASVGGTRDVKRVLRQLVATRDRIAATAAKSREGSQSEDVRLPDYIRQIGELNGLELNSEKALEQLKEMLERIIEESPRVRFTFADEPDDLLYAKLVSWVRENADSYVLVDISFSHQITGGFILQTPRRRYDFSWRRLFTGQEDRFAKLLREGSAK